MAFCRASVFRLPCGSVLLVMSHLTVLMPISALQFECGWATDDRQRSNPKSLGHHPSHTHLGCHHLGIDH